jgi:hypothetical protein
MGDSMYTTANFKTKKQLKDAVAFNLETGIGPVTYYQPGPFGGNEPTDGTIFLEGPHYPEPHRWYAEAVVKNGKIVKVK